MTFKEFQVKLVRDPILGKLLPMECKKTLPRLVLTGEKLYISFLGVQTKPISEGMSVKDPAYYLRLQYPQCRIAAYIRFAGEKNEHLMAQQERGVIKQLIDLFDNILLQYDEKSPELAQSVQQYNSILNQVLESEQLALLDKMDCL